jgi:AcrR family transcriptional regulator
MGDADSEQATTARGGRSARVRQAVLDATSEALIEHGPRLRIADVAALAGVHETSIYRRASGRT